MYNIISPPGTDARRGPSPGADQLVLATVSAHAEALLRTARRYSICADDAYDAYQRGLEIFMRRAATLDPDRAARWLHVVVRNEALAVRRSRGDVAGASEHEAEIGEPAHVPGPEERALAADETTRAAEALQRLKPHELQAMWLKASGLSYQEICDATGWTYTKVNRCLAEGRKSFLERFAGIEAGRECERWRPVLSAIVDGEATAAQLADARPHLRNCAACRGTIAQLRDAQRGLQAVLPVGGLAAAGGSAGDGGGFLARIWESLTGAIHERVASSAVKVQMLLDTTSATKAAAVAASAAAVAGGGAAAVVHERADRVPKRAVAATVARTPARPAPAPMSPREPRAATLIAASTLRAKPTTTAAKTRARAATTAASRAAGTSTASSRAATPATVAGEFVENQPITTPRSTTPTSTKPRALGNGGEFDP